MKRYTSSLGRFLLLLLTLHSVAFASVWEINVNTGMTEEGHKLEHPTTDHPVYYYPYAVGYQEDGSDAAKTKKLSANVPIERFLAEALASQGYLVTHVAGTKLDPSPSLLLVFKWGYINSYIYDEEVDDIGITVTHQYNERAHQKSLLLLGIKESDLIGDSRSKIDLVTSADDNRYYVTIAAYDCAAYFKYHKKILLWITRMSIPKQELDMDQVVLPLIKTGTPFLGRETIKPHVVDLGDPNGKVEAGTPVVAPGAAQPTATTPAPPQH
jgi:hypothetical protein